MSAYQVNEDLIDLVTSSLVSIDWSNYNVRGESVSIYLPDDVMIYTDAARECVATDNGYSRFVVACRAQGAGNVIGRELVAANVASVAYRYPDDTRADKVGGMVSYLPADYKFRPVSRDRFADYPHALAAFACFTYQACETGETTLAGLLVDAARRKVCERISDGVDAPWHWCREWHKEQMDAIRETLKKGVTA